MTIVIRSHIGARMRSIECAIFNDIEEDL